jgi:hypothetical protein
LAYACETAFDQGNSAFPAHYGGRSATIRAATHLLRDFDGKPKIYCDYLEHKEKTAKRRRLKIGPGAATKFL